jgi:5-methylcytosine-specific restriction endonuclease McrA
MLSREARVALLTVTASIKYGAAIKETATLLDELIELVMAIDPLPKRVVWPRRLLIYLAEYQHGICPACGRRLPNLNDSTPHIDHVVPWSQGGDNGEGNLRLLHARCNLLKGDECNPDDVIRHLDRRLLSLRKVLIVPPLSN